MQRLALVLLSVFVALPALAGSAPNVVGKKACVIKCTHSTEDMGYHLFCDGAELGIQFSARHEQGLSEAMAFFAEQNFEFKGCDVYTNTYNRTCYFVRK